VGGDGKCVEEETEQRGLAYVMAADDEDGVGGDCELCCWGWWRTSGADVHDDEERRRDWREKERISRRRNGSYCGDERDPGRTAGSSRCASIWIAGPRYTCAPSP